MQWVRFVILGIRIDSSDSSSVSGEQPESAFWSVNTREESEAMISWASKSGVEGGGGIARDTKCRVLLWDRDRWNEAWLDLCREQGVVPQISCINVSIENTCSFTVETSDSASRSSILGLCSQSLHQRYSFTSRKKRLKNKNKTTSYCDVLCWWKSVMGKCSLVGFLPSRDPPQSLLSFNPQFLDTNIST